MILGLTDITSGEVDVFGQNIKGREKRVYPRIGAIIETPGFYPNLTGTENLEIFAKLRGTAAPNAVKNALEIVGLPYRDKKLFSKYSLGMKQRLGLAAALLGKPKLLLLDEPTNGLDPAGIQEMRELICSLPETLGITVLISSHLLSEIDQMASHVGIINQGALIFQDSLSVLHEHSRSKMLLHTSDDQTALQYLKHSGISCHWQNGRIMLNTLEDNRIMQAVSLLVNSGIGILRLEEQQMSLEEIFLHLTGKQVSL